MKLLIVESPGKLKTLRKILGPEWILEASVGHTTELAHDGNKKLGFDLNGNEVITRYIPRGPRGKQVLSHLRQAVKRADEVYLAMDPDREGEAIAWHLVEQLKLRKFVRVSYTQITASAVQAAIAKPRKLDYPLVHAQRARQCLDKLVGYEVSPLLWNSSGGKSAGRVQSATLHLICERERERLRFKPQDYWTLHSLYTEGFTAIYEPLRSGSLGAGVEAQNLGANGSDSSSGAAGAAIHAPTAGLPSGAEIESAASRVSSLEEAKRIEALAKQHPHIVTEVLDREEKRLPPAPFITSSLQQMANVRLRLSPQQTMKIAQELYEGVGGSGLITYMRTDAVTLSPEFIADARKWLSANAPQVLAEKPPTFRTSAQAQGAHEAIRPTDVSKTPESLRSSLSADQFRLYEMIWSRAVASQCKAATLSKGRVVIEAGPTRWVARRSSVIEEGYLLFWKNTEDDQILPDVRKGQRLNLKAIKTDKKSTQPPPRYSEAKLIQLMEKLGIGRPSTYASTVATLKDRDYAFLDKNVIAPTALGMLTDDVLMKAMPDIVNIEFTAKMETSLDQIAEGKIEWQGFLCNWNSSYLQAALSTARRTLSNSPVTPLVAAPWKSGASSKFKKSARYSKSARSSKFAKKKTASSTGKSKKSKPSGKPFGSGSSGQGDPDIPF